MKRTATLLATLAVAVPALVGCGNSDMRELNDYWADLSRSDVDQICLAYRSDRQGMLNVLIPGMLEILPGLNARQVEDFHDEKCLK